MKNMQIRHNADPKTQLKAIALRDAFYNEGIYHVPDEHLYGYAKELRVLPWQSRREQAEKFVRKHKSLYMLPHLQGTKTRNRGF